MVSLMRQYVPCGTAAQYPEINRKLTDDEYEEVELHFLESRIEDGSFRKVPPLMTSLSRPLMVRASCLKAAAFYL